MDDPSWRVLVAFDRKEDVRSVVDYLKAIGEVTAAGGAVSLASDKRSLFAYAPTAEVIENVARLISSAADSLGTKPSQVTVARWIPDELRWSDQKPTPAPSGDGPVVEATESVVSLFNSPI
jgi:hypothetical protein